MSLLESLLLLTVGWLDLVVLWSEKQSRNKIYYHRMVLLHLHYLLLADAKDLSLIILTFAVDLDLLSLNTFTSKERAICFLFTVTVSFYHNK